MFFYYDPTYILVIIGAVICMAASAHVNSTYRRYAQVRSRSGMTGKDAAERILHANGIYDVTVHHIPGNLSDHYNPASVAAIGVAAHECGHAIQHAKGYAPLQIRGALVPVANFGSMAAWPLIIIGLFMNGNTASLLINLGILLFSAAVLFQIVTLPVEFNASSRAIRILETSGMLYPEELSQTKAVLRAAAMTYVASAASMILQLLRLLIISGGRRDD